MYILEQAVGYDQGYIKWSNGLLEVWGFSDAKSLYSTVTLPYNLAFMNAYYNVIVTWFYGSNKNIGTYSPIIGERTTTSFTIVHDSAGAQQMCAFYVCRGRWK